MHFAFQDNIFLKNIFYIKRYYNNIFIFDIITLKQKKLLKNINLIFFILNLTYVDKNSTPNSF
jgi:hypothetical protein